MSVTLTEQLIDYFSKFDPSFSHIDKESFLENLIDRVKNEDLVFNLPQNNEKIENQKIEEFKQHYYSNQNSSSFSEN